MKVFANNTEVIDHCTLLHTKPNTISETLRFSQGLNINKTELDYLWSLLDELEPRRELHKYRQVMNFFFNRTRPLVAELKRLKRYASEYNESF